MAKYSKKIVDTIITSIMSGKTIKTALKELDISFQTWSNWIGKDSELLNRYHQSKISALDYELSTIKEELNQLCKDSIDPKGVSMARVNAMKLKQGQVQYELSKLMPKQYGTTQQISLNNADNEPLVISWKS